MKRNYSLHQVSEIAQWVIQHSLYKSILFYGEMGVGKTTLIKEIVKQLGSDDVVSSPTFSIVNEYITPEASVFHFDFYRIEDESEVYDIGFEEYFADEADWQLMEWPELIPNLLPENATQIFISLNKDGARCIELK